MENKVRIKGGDTVQLKSGEIVKVADIKNNHIIVCWGEWYHFDQVEKIVESIV